MKFSISACSGRTGWDVEPEDLRDIDVQELAEGLENLLVETPHVIIARIGDGEISIYPDCSMFVKKVETREEAEELVNHIGDLIERLQGDQSTEL